MNGLLWPQRAGDSATVVSRARERSGGRAGPAPAREYWPTEGWRASAPEEQGMDAGRLLAMRRHIEGELPHVRSVLIVRHGYLVFEAYAGEYDPDALQGLHSMTKSVTCALVGIALQEGTLDALDQRVMALFPEYAALDADRRIEEITIEHLLTMTSGLVWHDEYLHGWLSSDDPARFTLKRPMAGEPGATFNYNSSAAHLLSVILTRSTGASALDFADERLFGPLGISERQWLADSRGHHIGAGGLFLRPRDMAKFGYLYLNQGEWAGRQIVPTDFVRESTRAQNPGGAPENESYGYLWWVTTVEGHAAYFAGGYGGQLIYVVPDVDVVVVMTSNADRHHIENRAIVGEYVVAAIEG